MIKKLIKLVSNKMGFDVVKFNIHNRYKLLKYYDINLIFDIGANVGQYAMELRKNGYKGKIVSFEPLQNAYANLVRNADGDSLWRVANIGIGEFDGKARINVSKNSYSSSFLSILPSVLNNCPEAVFIGQEEVIVSKIDSILNEYWLPRDRLFMKVDTQGYEKSVILGALESLPKMIGIEMELSLIPLYDGEQLFMEIVSFICEKGYNIMHLSPGFSDSSNGQLLQVDCIFFR